jgi:cytochrome c-type biogenesis protein CcsB
MMTFLGNEVNLENFFMNVSFLILLFSTILYWIQTAFQYSKNYGMIGMILANFSLLTLLILRWENSGHFPLSNLYESFIFLSWTLTFIHLLIEYSIQIPFFGAMTSPSALLTNAFATFCLPVDMQQSSPLVPALQSNWLMMHVTVMILSYAALICGSLLSIAFLILNIDFLGKKKEELSSLKKENIFTTILELISISKTTISAYPNFSSNTTDNSYNTSNTFGSDNVQSNMNQPENFILNPKSSLISDSSSYSSNSSYSQTRQTRQLHELSELFDNLSYRILGLGFPFLTIGILSGAVWANEAWGSYWSWDPKETWALLTWFVFAIYLHVRLKKGWNGKKPALIASFGFFVVWICYLGVNLMGQGLHSYGWVHS